MASPWAVRTGWLAALIALLGGWRAIDGYAAGHLFLVNRTESLPNWAFFVARGSNAGIGDTVFFAPPRAALVTAHFGADPGPFGKIVYGTGGDEIMHRGNVVLLRRKGSAEWREVAEMKRVSLRGEPLAPGPVGVIPEHCFYVGTPHKDGFDSRYQAIGFICRDRLIAIAQGALL